MSGPLFLAGTFYGASILLFLWFAQQLAGANHTARHPGLQAFRLVFGMLLGVAAGFALAYAANFLVFAKLLHLPEIPYLAAGAGLDLTLIGFPAVLTIEITKWLTVDKNQTVQGLASLAALILGVSLGFGLRYLIFIQLLGFTEEQSPEVFFIGYLSGMLYHVLLISAIYKLGQRDSPA